MFGYKDRTFAKTAKTMGMLITVVLVLLFLQPTITSVAKAQTQYTTLKGYVIDTSSIGIGNVEIGIYGIDTTYTNSTQTGYDGYYEINVLGGYVSIRASMSGYQEYMNIINVGNAEFWNNITLQSSVEGRITGYVFNNTGVFLNNVTIAVRDIYSSNGNTTTVDFDGFYDIKTEYSLVVLTAARESYNLYVTLIDFSQNNISWLNITMDQLPIAVVNAPAYANIDENISFDANASTDDDGIDAYHWEFGDGTNGTGKNVIHKYSTARTYIVNLTVFDTVGGVGGDTLVVTVGNVTLINHAPVITSILPQTATVGAQFKYNVTATDADNNILTYTDDTSLFEINSTTGAISFTPTAADVGNHTIKIFVNDGTVIVNTTFTLNITAAVVVNHAPTIASIPSQTATVDAKFELQINATDLDNDSLNYSVNVGVITNTGLFKYTPATVGEINITVTVNDGRGGVTNTTFKLTVKEKPAPPKKGFLFGFEILAVLSGLGVVLFMRRR
jgi:hypothetical protein